MKKPSAIYLLCILSLVEASKIVIKSLSIRHIRKNDFGLIFDTLVENDGAEPRETLSFNIQAEKCCLETNGIWDCNVQKLYGARIEQLEPSSELIVTLVWPTLVLHNRVGNCSLSVKTSRPLGKTTEYSKLISFNTKINPSSLPDYLLHYFNDMKKSHGYTKCDSEDLDPFQNCKPVNCVEKYFGMRNFFENSSCVPAAVCQLDQIYDYDTNECQRFGEIFTNDELNEMKKGKFSNWIDVGEEKVEASMTHKASKMLKRIRRDLNSEPSPTFLASVESFLLLMFKGIGLVILAYLVGCIIVFIIGSLCFGCGFVIPKSTSN